MPHEDKTYKYEPLPFYPHMGPKDAHIWNNFVNYNPTRFNTAVYDMRCGEIVEPDQELPQSLKDAWRDLNRGRIDVVAEDDTNIYVIEVKPHARGGAMGQALENALLYKREYNPVKPVIPTVITDIIIPNTKISCCEKSVLLMTP